MTIEHKVTEILADLDYLNNPYFVDLHNGAFDKADFIETQMQFYFAVTYFVRPMAALAAKIPTPDLRIEVVRNVWEEHGEGNLSKTHTKTFEIFLQRIGNVTLQDICSRALWPEIRLFNTTLTGVCVLDDYMTGVGVMGMIEYMFSCISGRIGSGILARGWLTSETMIHYDTHEVLDVKHAADFFNVVRKGYNDSEEDRYHVEQGLWLGATIFDGLYRQLYQHRKRRCFRTVSGPHSRADGFSPMA